MLHRGRHRGGTDADEQPREPGGVDEARRSGSIEGDEFNHLATLARTHCGAPCRRKMVLKPGSRENRQAIAEARTHTGREVEVLEHVKAVGGVERDFGEDLPSPCGQSSREGMARNRGGTPPLKRDIDPWPGIVEHASVEQRMERRVGLAERNVRDDARGPDKGGIAAESLKDRCKVILLEDDVVLEEADDGSCGIRGTDRLGVYQSPDRRIMDPAQVNTISEHPLQPGPLRFRRPLVGLVDQQHLAWRAGLSRHGSERDAQVTVTILGGDDDGEVHDWVEPSPSRAFQPGRPGSRSK